MALEIYAYKRYASVVKYSGSEKSVTIPQYYRDRPVTEIRENAFAGSAVEAVILPDTLEEIGDRAFFNCKKLRYIGCNPAWSEQEGTAGLRNRDTHKVKKIGRDAFWGCSRLQNLAVEEKVPVFKSEPENDPFHFFSDLILDLEELSESEEQENRTEAPEENMEKLEQGKPLLVLNVTHRKESAGMRSRLKGSWRKKSGDYVFTTDESTATDRTGLTVCQEEDSLVVRPLLDYFVGHDMQVFLYGAYQESHYEVYDIAPVKEQKDVPAEVFRMAVERFRRAVPGNEECRAERPSCLITGDSACDAFVEMCGELIPQWVHNAYRRNRDMLKIGSNVGIDGKRHARISMEILVNTDWNFTPMHVPALAEAKSRLDDRFSGLEEPKQIFLEILAQIRLTGKLPPYGLLFVGPPGTGKTTFAKAAAHMMSENIIHVDVSTLGTNTEEAAGSSRIYSNSQPGFLLEGMYRNRSSTGVLLVNEFDKARESSSGYSVVNALLSVLDKNGFYDNSLEEVIPTQNLYAIATANDLSAISKPLLDRFCIIRIPGYSKEEKKDIFSRYALPRAMDGIPEENIHVDEAAVDLLISEYSVESGVREIEQFAARIVQNYCLAADGEIRTKKHYGVEDIRRLFGPGKQIVRHFAIHPGQVNAAVSDNGKVRFLLLEAAVVPGSGKFHVIGMGSRQRGYSEAAYWCVRNTVSPSVCDLSKCDVTVFVPQTLPDGYENHVGAATYAAICSRILNRTYALSGSCFIGGCDLNGNLFWDDNDLTAVLYAMKENGLTTLYAPLGTGKLMDPACGDTGVSVVEAVDAEMLVRLAMHQSE